MTSITNPRPFRAAPRTVAKALAAGLCLALVGAAPYDPPVTGQDPRVQKDIDLAYLTLNGAINPQHLQTLLFKLVPRPAGPMRGGGMPQRPNLPATKVFDQLYYLGTNIVTSWALDTRDGIIVFDALETPGEAQQFIEGGLRSRGLDPARIKYVLVTHGHNDHYGGAKYLQEKFKARILMTEADWKLAESTAAEHPDAGLPKRDMVATDGQTLMLGGTTIRMFVTPGHTPGVLSTIFPVTDKGRPHVVSFFGGLGLNSVPEDPAAGGYATLRASLLRFAKLSLDADADVLLADHPFNDGSYAKVEQVRGAKPPAQNPWVAGKDAVLRFYSATTSAVNAVETYFQLKGQAKQS